jgi:predicted transcriptional regulator
MSQKTLLLSIRPQYAEKIFDGTKKVELRRIKPNVNSGDTVFVYVSSPVKALRGKFIVDKVLQEAPEKLWEQIKNDVGLTKEEYKSYFEGASFGFGIYLKAVQDMPSPLSLGELRELWSNFHPPQSYKYLKPHEINLLNSPSAPLIFQPI